MSASEAGTTGTGRRAITRATRRRPLMALAALAALAPGCQSTEERIAALEAEIAKLEERVAGRAAARDLLDRVEVVEAGFEGSVDGQPGTARFTITVRNGTPHSLDRIRYEAVLMAPDGSRELLRGKIDGGLPGWVEQDASLSYHLYPMEGSPWFRFQPPPGATLRLTPIRLSAIGNSDLAAAPPPVRSAADEAALVELREELAALDPSRR